MPFQSVRRRTDDTVNTMKTVLLYICAALAVAASGVLSLSVFTDDDRSRVSQPFADQLADVSLDHGSAAYRSRTKRESLSPSILNGVSDGNITSEVFHLNESRQQLMVHWVGENSNVIICLAREGYPSSSVYISYDYGNTYLNKTKEFKIDATKNLYASIDKFYIHPTFKSYCVYTDVINRKIFTTTDHSKTIKSIPLSFVPSEVTYKPDAPLVFIVHDKVSPTKLLWITHDFGITWTMLEEHVKSYFWVPTKWNLYKSGHSLVIQREESATTSTVIAVSENINSGQNNLSTLAVNVLQLKARDDYMFVTVQLSKNNLDLLVSYKGGNFVQTRFDTELDRRDYHIADITANRIMVAVAHTRALSNLYISDVVQSSDEDTVSFSLSLERVVAYFPNITWTESLISELWAEPFADIHKVKGLQGIYIVSQVSPSMQSGSVDIGPEHIVTLISFDWGFDWRLLNVTRSFSHCEKSDNCSLHLTQMFAHVYPVTRTHTFILSSKSAPGIIMATGVVGKSLKGNPGVFVSRDAGLTWRQVLKEMHFYNIGDHGGILIAVRYYKGEKEETSQILYSTDEGETWLEKNFTNSQIKVYELMTEPGENTTVFTMFGSVMEKHEWLIIKIDLKKAFSYNCTKKDYKFWSPITSKDHLKTSCVLGQTQIFQRRALKANCYNGMNYDRPIQTKTCDCDIEDYTCDRGFTWFSNSKQCIRNKTSSFDPYLIPSSCKPGLMYNRTKGYRLIPGDMCKGGRSLEFIPQEVPCPFEEKSEFIVVAQKERILRLSGNLPYVVLPVKRLENVIAIEFDVKNNCVFWADIITDTIGRQCLSDGQQGPEILVNSGLSSVEGMAYDWISKHLYFVDGALAKIEVIRTNTKIPGHMRKTILGPTHLKKPRGLAVHPRLGYLFWTDWAVGEAKVARANLDGSDMKTLISNDSIEWPNGLTVDYIAERLYWVDARHDYIASCDLHGNNIKKVIKFDKKVSHPFAVTILKDWIYWDDWKQNSIFMSDKDHGAKIQTVATHLPGLMDLKVYSHMSQIDINECSNNNKCSHFCFGLPNQKFSCQCPDNMSKSDNCCLCPGLKEPFANGTCPSAGQTCSVDYFQCANGNCVPKYWQCDGHNDCGDNSDEVKCTKVSCGPNSFQCNNGKCIPSYWTCDFDPDCEDSSDEINCKYSNCSVGQFRCKNGRCISMHWHCDLEDDCHDGSDEVDCVNISNNSSTTCPPSSFHCPGTANNCIPAKWQCDGEKDCPEGKDEINCGIENCESWQFECANKKCIFASWKCDGDDDCNDGLRSDEVNCSSIRPYPAEPTTPSLPFITNGTCSEWLFRCSNGKCIPYWWKCDNVMDCEDGSDEEQCGTLTPTSPKTNTSIVTPKNMCPQHYFQCNTGLCIEDSWVCDEIFDCDQGEDETNCKNNNFVGRCKNNREFKCRISGSCISIEKVCDGTPQCPDASDEMFCTNNNNNQTPGTPSCGMGLFPCDGSRCIPASRRCNKHKDCYDGTDEEYCDTINNTLSIQVFLMFIDEHETTSYSLSLYWAAPKNLSLEYLPSISESRMPETCVNKTWVSTTNYKFTSLKPYTAYNMTVFVRQKKVPDTIYPPAFFILASTAEGVPSAPLNVIVKQVNAEEVLVTWTRPENPAGRILSYNVYVEPPHPAMVLSVEADYNNATQSYPVRSSLYRLNIEYSFWVTAKLSEFESEHSAVKRFHFDEDSLVDVNLKLNVTTRTENSITVSWESVEHADGFTIISLAPIKEDPYPNFIQSFNISNNNNVLKFTITKLSPGVTYTINVIPYNKRYIGMKYTIVTKTDGQPLPSVTNITGSLVNIKDKIESTIRVQWNAPKQYGNTKWLYGVYWDTNVNDLLNGPKYNTSATIAILINIESCTSLMIDVGVIGPNGIGPLSKRPFTIITPFDPTVPPKDIKIEQLEHSNEPMILISWKASCHPVQQSYKVSILESNKNKNFEIIVPNVSDTEATLHFSVHYGGNYFIRISTMTPNAVPSSLINYQAPELPSPHQVKVFSMPDGHYEIYWHKPNVSFLHKEPNVHYLVHMSEGSELNVTTAKTYQAEDSPFIIIDPPTSNQLSVAVQLATNEGYVSKMSEVFSFIPQNVDSQSSEVVVVGVNTGWMSMILVLLVIGLSAGLTYFVVRHRNLQNSFVQFANSRYDTRSGSATFTGVDSLDDEPAVQGFSDDEPLVIT